MDHPRLVEAIGHLCFFGLFVAGDKLGWGHDCPLVLYPLFFFFFSSSHGSLGRGLFWVTNCGSAPVAPRRFGKPPNRQRVRCIFAESELGQEQSLGDEITSPAFASTISRSVIHVVVCDFSLLADSYVLPAGMREMTPLPNWHQKHKNKP